MAEKITIENRLVYYLKNLLVAFCFFIHFIAFADSNYQNPMRINQIFEQKVMSCKSNPDLILTDDFPLDVDTRQIYQDTLNGLEGHFSNLRNNLPIHFTGIAAEADQIIRLNSTIELKEFIELSWQNIHLRYLLQTQSEDGVLCEGKLYFKLENNNYLFSCESQANFNPTEFMPISPSNLYEQIYLLMKQYQYSIDTVQNSLLAMIDNKYGTHLASDEIDKSKCFPPMTLHVPLRQRGGRHLKIEPLNKPDSFEDKSSVYKRVTECLFDDLPQVSLGIDIITLESDEFKIDDAPIRIETPRNGVFIIEDAGKLKELDEELFEKIILNRLRQIETGMAFLSIKLAENYSRYKLLVKQYQRPLGKVSQQIIMQVRQESYTSMFQLMEFFPEEFAIALISEPSFFKDSCKYVNEKTNKIIQDKIRNLLLDTMGLALTLYFPATGIVKAVAKKGIQELASLSAVRNITNESLTNIKKLTGIQFPGFMNYASKLEKLKEIGSKPEVYLVALGITSGVFNSYLNLEKFESDKVIASLALNFADGAKVSNRMLNMYKEISLSEEEEKNLWIDLVASRSKIYGTYRSFLPFF